MAFLISKLNKIKEEDFYDDEDFFKQLLVSIEVNLDYYVTINRYQSINKKKKLYKKVAYFQDEKIIEVTFKRYGAFVDLYYNGNILFHLFYIGHDFYNIINIEYFYNGKILVEEEYSIIPDNHQELKKRKFYINGLLYKELRYNYKEKPKAIIFYENIIKINPTDYSFLYHVENNADMSKTILQLVMKGFSNPTQVEKSEGLNIQSDVVSIYAPSALGCINELFDDSGQLKYKNARMVEVPNDLYQVIIEECERGIKEEDDNLLKQKIKQGNFTYNQVKNLFDYSKMPQLTIHNENIILSDQSISSLVKYALYCWRNKKDDESIPSEIDSKLFESSFLISVFIDKSSVRIKKMRNSIMNLFKSMSGKQSASYVSKRLNAANLYKMVSRNHLSHLLRANLLINLVTAVLISSSDLYCLFGKLISPKQAFKNIFKKTITLVGAAAGASLAATLLPTFGIPYEKQVKVLVGSIVGGYSFGLFFKIFLDKFIVDDKNTMISIIEEELYQVSINYLLNEQETKQMITEFMEIEMIPTLQQMYKSSNRTLFAHNLCVLLAMERLMKREWIKSEL